MTTQDTENQIGGAENDTVAGVLAEDAVGVDEAGNDISIKAGEEVILNAADIVDAPAPSALEKLHADTIKLIEAARAEGIDIIAFVHEKIAQIA